jgi:hypothetical protein
MKNNDYDYENIEKFLEYFPDCLLQSFDDVMIDGKKREDGKLADVFPYKRGKIETLQDRGAGIYFSVNPTTNGTRGIEHLKNISALGMDLDVGKEKENLTAEERTERKKILLEKIERFEDTPHFVLESKNGYQPVWLFESFLDYKTTNDANTIYKELIEGLEGHISKSEGDFVVRVLRLPHTKHLKTFDDPFEITIAIDNSTLPRYDFNAFYKKYRSAKTERKTCENTTWKDAPVLPKEIEQIPLTTVITDVAEEKGIKIRFESVPSGTQSIYENNEKTSAFVSQNGKFCYSMSEKMRRGNQISVVMYYLDCSEEEAIEWIHKQYDIQLSKRSNEEDAQDSLVALLQQPDEKSVFFSDVIGDLFFQTQYIKGKFFVFFSNGEYTEVQEDNKRHSFYYQKQKYYFKTRCVKPSSSIHRPNKEAINMFLGKKEWNGDKVEMFLSLVEIIHEYYDFYCDEEAYIVISNIVHSYILNILGKTFYLLLSGDAGTGKSTLQNVLAKLQFNGVFAGKTSMAAMVRNVHHHQIALNIDEFEKLGHEEKTNATGILNTGFYKGGTYEITEKEGANFIPKEFHTFSTKSFSVNSMKFDPSLLSRCIVIHTVRSTKRTKNIYALSVEENEKFQSLRNRLFVFTLCYWKEIIQSIEKVKDELAENRIYARKSDLISIIAGIYEFFTDGNKDLRIFLLEKDDFEEDSQKEDNRKYILLQYLVELMEQGQNPETIELNSTEIAEYINSQLELNEYDKYKATSSSVIKMLKSMRCIDKGDTARNVKMEGKVKKIWTVKSKNIREIILRSSFSDLKKGIP